MGVTEDEIVSITDSMDMNLSNLWEIVEDRGAWCAVVHEVTRNNYFKCRWIKCSNQRHRLAQGIQKQDPYICCLQEIHFRPQDTYRLKVRGWRNIFHANRKQKKAGVPILI